MENNLRESRCTWERVTDGRLVSGCGGCHGLVPAVGLGWHQFAHRHRMLPRWTAIAMGGWLAGWLVGLVWSM